MTNVAEVELLPPPRPANPQVFENRPVLVDEYVALSQDGDVLYGSRSPNLGIVHEKPEHRLVLFMKLEGMSNAEVARRSGYTQAWVSQIVRQPWFQKRLLSELRATGREGIVDFLRVQLDDSFLRLVELRDNAKSEQVQAVCAMNIIDRVLGKPVQRSEVTLESTTRKVDRVESIREELTTLEAQERELQERLGKHVQ